MSVNFDEYSRTIASLNNFGTEGHERLVVRNGVLETKGKGNLLQRFIAWFYKPENERVETIARFAVNFFEEHSKKFENTDVIDHLRPIIYKKGGESLYAGRINAICQKIWLRKELNQLKNETEEKVLEVYLEIVTQIKGELGVKLTHRERISLLMAVRYLALVGDEKKAVDDDWAKKSKYIQPMIDMEKEKGSYTRFALDDKAFQIMRADDPSVEANWVRFGFEWSDKAGEPQVFVKKLMVESVDVAIAAPKVATKMNELWKKGAPVIGMLGAARLPEEQGGELLAHVDRFVDALSTGEQARPSAAYMTGGFRGAHDKRYGMTRAGYDSPKRKGKETYVIMPEAGGYDSHKEVTAKSFFGKQWGDDTPALSSACDGALFVRNVPAGKNFGAWTEVEIANFVKKDKPIVILDPTIEGEQKEEIFFGVPVQVFKSADKAAEYLKTKLPTEEEIKGREPMKIMPKLTAFMSKTQLLLSTKYYDQVKRKWVEKEPPALLKKSMRSGINLLRMPSRVQIKAGSTPQAQAAAP